MRGEASRIADRESRDSLAPKLRDTREDAWRIGNERFTITKVLDASIQLERALTDPSRPVADKVAVLKELLGDNAHPMTMEIMTDLVSRRWSRARDIANAVEDFGVDAMMYYADATDATLQVSIELSELHSALLNLPVVRAKLYDYQATSEARVKLFREVFSGKTLNKVTMRLAEHATCTLRRRRYLETIQWLINKFSRHMGESMVTVTTATPLKKEQIKRLVEVYSAKVGRQVHINSVVDPTVLGGMRIQVGDEVTDNTVVAQLQQLQRQIQTARRARRVRDADDRVRLTAEQIRARDALLVREGAQRIHPRQVDERHVRPRAAYAVAARDGHAREVARARIRPRKRVKERCFAAVGIAREREDHGRASLFRIAQPMRRQKAVDLYTRGMVK